MSKTRNLIHLVFATKHRRPTIDSTRSHDLYQYIGGIINKAGSKAIEINGVSDHVHILMDLNPNISLASLAREIKSASSKWVKTNEVFPKFESWGEGYYAGSLSPTHELACREYIMNQARHHGTIGFEEEIESWSVKNGISYNPLDWE